MSYGRYRKRMREIDLPPLTEQERIYLCVPYQARGFARYCHCGFDSELKLWFTGAYNTFLDELVELYGVHEHTSEHARELLRIALETPDRDELLARLKEKALDAPTGADSARYTEFED